MKISNNPIIYLAKNIWKFSKGERHKVVLYFILFIIANVIKFVEPLLVSQILNKIQLEGITAANISSILISLLVFPGVSIAFWIFHGPARVIETKNAFLVRANFKKYLLNGTMGLKSEWHTDHHSGDTIDKIEKATNSLYDFGCRSFEVIETIVQFVSSFLALMYFNVSSGFIMAFFVIFTVITILKFDKVLIKQWSELFKMENKISASVFDTLSNITTVIILRMEKLVAQTIFTKIMQPFKLAKRNIRINETKWFIVSVFGGLMTFLILSSYVYINFTAGKLILIGTLFVLYSYIQRITETFFRFAYLYSDIARAKTAVQNSEELSKEFYEKETQNSLILKNNWQGLKIESLNFSYHTKKGTDLHLNNVNLTIKRGQRIALIGESGGGKTTFLKIIRELYEPQRLKLSLDRKLLKNGFKTISENIALIPQDPEIFNTTVLDNITLGVPHKISYVKKFTDLACFTQVAERLPLKFNSSIVEKGVNLSGGEKQRLALARGLLASVDKSIILLDEPTSSVDFNNELKIYQNIFEEFPDKTIISSIHRLHLLSLFDCIYFFQKGKIIASGSLEDLLNTCEEFQKIWEKYKKHHKLSTK